ncbi:MAG TPA: hypothetical protein VD866_08630 [Urbifossiella sp.]|nr:hypothetical protein [Urbifossiella sp.]
MTWTRLAFAVALAAAMGVGRTDAQPAKDAGKDAVLTAQENLQQTQEAFAAAVENYKATKKTLDGAGGATDANKAALSKAADEKQKAMEAVKSAHQFVELQRTIAGAAAPKAAAAQKEEDVAQKLPPPKVLPAKTEPTTPEKAELAKAKAELAKAKAELAELIAGKVPGLSNSLADITLSLKGTDPGELARVNRLLRYTVLTGMARYQQGQYAEAVTYYRAGLLVAWPFLDKLEASHKANSGLERRVATALRSASTDDLTGTTYTDWQKAVILRTALNDILNAPHRGDPSKLVHRLGGSEAVTHIFRDAQSRSSTDVSRVVGFGSSGTIYQVFGSGGCDTASRVGLGSLPFDLPGTFDTEFTQTARIHAFARHLNTSLGRYCVPEPERDELLKRFGGDMLPF